VKPTRWHRDAPASRLRVPGLASTVRGRHVLAIFGRGAILYRIVYICYPGPGTTARKFSRRARRAACSSSWLHEGMALLRARSATDCWPGNGTQQQPRMGSMDGSYGFYPALGGSVWVSTATGRSWVRCGPTMPTLPALHAVCVPLSEPTDSLPSAHPRADRTARPSRCAEPD
jgi:hypothetical protein